jgi:monoamine oxidase
MAFTPRATATTASVNRCFTWPEGNAWLVQRLAAPLQGRMHTGRTVLRVDEQRHAVQVLACAGRRPEAWTAGTVVLALPLFVAARVLARPPAALQQAAAATRYAPWLVANLQLDKPLLDRPGLPPAWDSVAYGDQALGYVDAMHQSLRPQPGATVLTAYATLPDTGRGALLERSWSHWAQHVVDNFSTVHPDLRSRLQRIDLMRYGHAMAVPLPGGQASAAARAALRGGSGRVRFAHADLAGYSVFEEAFFTMQVQVGRVPRCSFTVPLICSSAKPNWLGCCVFGSTRTGSSSGATSAWPWCSTWRCTWPSLARPRA